jgi:small-conductance mechanosensitive channel
MRVRAGLIVGLLVLGAADASLVVRAQGADEDIVTAPVELDGTTLFRVRGVASYPAATRAQSIRERIVAAAADRAIAPESLRVVESGGVLRIMAGDQALLAVVDADATMEQVGRGDLAAAHLLRIQQAIGDYRAARSLPALRSAGVNTMVATLILALSVVALIWLWRRLDRLLMRRLERHIHSVEIQSFEVMRADRIFQALRHTLVGVRTLLLFAGGLVYVGYVLAQWPWTRGLSRDMVGFALSPLEVIGAGLVANIPSLVFLAVLYYVVRTIVRLIRLFFEAVERGTVKLERFDPDWAAPTYKIVRVAVIAFGLIVAYPYIPGSESAAFKGMSLFIGVLFSLGSSSAISNIIAGYMMTYRRAFKVGDRVKIGDAVGDVIETRLQVTHLRSLKNEEIVIPNSQILTGDVLNYTSLSRSEGLILHTEVGIGYETPWRQVEAMLIEAARRTEGLASAPSPFVLLKRLGDFAVVYEINAYCSNVKAMAQLYTALHRQILDVFNEYGVQIMTPAYEGDPEKPKVVPPPEWYAAPASMPPANAAVLSQG